MRWPRKASPPSGRQRRLRSDESSMPVSQTFSYSGRRNETELNTGRQLQREAMRSASRRARSWLQRIGMIILMIAVVASAVNVLTISTNPQVRALDSGNKQLLKDFNKYEAAANQLLTESVWNRNKLTVNTSHIEDELLLQFPELEDLSITIPLLAHRPIIYVQPAKPALIITNNSGAFVVGSTGKTLLKANQLADLNSLNLLVLNDQSGLHLNLNRQALPAEQVSFIDMVKTQLAAKQFKIATMTLPPASSQLDVQLDGQPYLVKFNLQANQPREQAGVFLATIDHLQKQNTIPAHYVDVRVPGRAYYQ